MGDADVSLQELHHREGERQLIRSLLHLCPSQRVLHHELRQIAHNLRGGCHLKEGEERRRTDKQERKGMFA